MSGILTFNVNNNCSTGSTALFLARQAVASGAADCVLALGFEQMSPGALGSPFQDRPSPFDHFDALTDDLVGNGQIPLALRYFGGAGQAHMQQYGIKISTFAKIRATGDRQRRYGHQADRRPRDQGRHQPRPAGGDGADHTAGPQRHA